MTKHVELIADIDQLVEMNKKLLKFTNDMCLKHSYVQPAFQIVLDNRKLIKKYGLDDLISAREG